jgi:hypothetical protein
MKRFSMVESFAFSWETIKKYPLLILVPTILFKTIEASLTYYLKNRNVIKGFREFPAFILQCYQGLPLQQAILWTLLILILVVLMAVLSATVSIGQIRIGCHAFDGQDDQIKWSVYRNFGKRIFLIFIGFFLITLFYSIFWSTFNSLKWFNLVSIPFYILFALMFLFTFYVLVEKRVTLMDAFRTSYRLTNGIKGSLVVFYVVYLLFVMVIGTPLLFITNFLGRYGSFLPYVFQSIMLVFLKLATIYIYKDISYQDAHPEDPKDESDQSVQDINSEDGIRIPIETLLNR